VSGAPFLNEQAPGADGASIDFMAGDNEVLVAGKRFRVVRREVERRDGGTERREMIVHPGCVVLLPVLDDGRVLLILNHRFTVGRTLWELPAGTLDPGESPEQCAARELEEETGYRAGRLTPLLQFYTAPGISDERAHVFLAEGLTRGEQHLDDTEKIEVHALPVDEVKRMVSERKLEDAKSIASLLYWWAG
jgi:ADP-ribose pyrophosphatase